MKILSISSNSKKRDWSDSITNLTDEIGKSSSNIATLINIDIIDNSTDFDELTHDCDKILIHHSINFYRLVLKIGFVRFLKIRKKTIFFAHEGEPFIRNFSIIIKVVQNPKLLLRYSRVYNRLPYFLCNRTIILSEIQRPLYPKAITVHYLKPNSNIFKPRNLPIIRDILIPANIYRPEKCVIECIKHLPNLSLTHIFEIDNFQMPAFYNSSRIVLISGHFETYCLTALEAFACNRVVVSNRTIGVIEDLLSIYTTEELASKGLYIYHSLDSLRSIIELALRHQYDKNVTTEDLLEYFSIDYKNLLRIFT